MKIQLSGSWPTVRWDRNNHNHQEQQMLQANGLAILLLIGCSLTILACDAQTNEKKESFISGKTAAKALVVTYSYTGNTKAVADEIINRFKADPVTIMAKDYDGFSGGMRASYDAWTEVILTTIEPETVDMSQYDLVFLGSPIWWYRPAVPLWTFVEKNDFTGKTVVLFNTFNSRFKSEYIEEFKSLVEKNGGQFTDHLYVKRGRWYAQLSKAELLEKFNTQLDYRRRKLQ